MDKEAEEILRWYMAKPEKIRTIMRDHDITIDDLDDKMQKFAFALYTYIVEGAEKARMYFEEKEDE